ncbi:hypothetical protein ACA910_021623 [Epithemia clementina (nom. ined.)]
MTGRCGGGIKGHSINTPTTRTVSTTATTNVTASTPPSPPWRSHILEALAPNHHSTNPTTLDTNAMFRNNQYSPQPYWQLHESWSVEVAAATSLYQHFWMQQENVEMEEWNPQLQTSAQHPKPRRRGSLGFRTLELNEPRVNVARR